MTEPIVICFPRQTPSQNQLGRYRHYQATELRNGYQMVIRQRLTELGIRPRWPRVPPRQQLRQYRGHPDGDLFGGKPAVKMRLTIRRYSAGQLDPDNLVGGCKHLVDALAREGLLWDDSTKWLDARYEHHRAKAGGGHTEVEIGPA